MLFCVEFGWSACHLINVRLSLAKEQGIHSPVSQYTGSAQSPTEIAHVIDKFALNNELLTHVNSHGGFDAFGTGIISTSIVRPVAFATPAISLRTSVVSGANMSVVQPGMVMSIIFPGLTLVGPLIQRGRI
jgi:hypothetical protein